MKGLILRFYNQMMTMKRLTKMVKVVAKRSESEKRKRKVNVTLV